MCLVLLLCVLLLLVLRVVLFVCSVLILCVVVRCVCLCLFGAFSVRFYVVVCVMLLWFRCCVACLL